MFSRICWVSYCEVEAGFGAGEGVDDGVGLDGDGFLRWLGGELEAVEKDLGALGKAGIFAP